jgi:hypothetical protein
VAEAAEESGALVAVGQQERGPVELVVVEHLPVDVQGGGRVALGLQEGRGRPASSSRATSIRSIADQGDGRFAGGDGELPLARQLVGAAPPSPG